MTHGVGPEPTTRQPASYRLAASTVVALGLAASGAALAQGETPLAPGDPGGLVCTVSGYDVIIRNNGTDPIASGASVEWSVPFARRDGNHVLTKDLVPGGRVFLNGALGSNFLSSKSACEAMLATQGAPPTTNSVIAPPSQT